MTEYQKTYIELKKQFVATNEGPDNVRALYTFKEELEQSEDQQAKEVLVDVYDLLDFNGLRPHRLSALQMADRRWHGNADHILSCKIPPTRPK